MVWHQLISRLTTDRHDYFLKMVTTDMMTTESYLLSKWFVITNLFNGSDVCVLINYKCCPASCSAMGEKLYF